ncbi:endosome-associated-trafficking regulator 1-like [Podarcis muralis]|uniref:endosome-associated-trafficking regulator 1-like n=1 Tax=Podarcis muralis TaxID=64176 RepID=UPI0010A02D9E|nr:endosome-associated-trafficking regulator 1-like [Podarcis muralis]XP_053262269.1 endosome-associated-trafficking regulator 1-like [Podarcis raffonei]
MPRPLLAGCSHSRGLKEEEEEIQPCYHHHIPPPPDHIKGHISSGDNQMKNSNDPPTFSLKGMGKNKNRGPGRQHEVKNRNYRKKMARQNLGLEVVSLSPEPLGLNLEFQEPLYKEATVSDHLSDDDDDWRERYPPSAYDKVHLSRIASMAQCDPYNYNTTSLSGMEAFSSWGFSDNETCIGCPSHTKTDESYVAHEEPIENMEYVSPQLSYQELREENSMLRRKIRRIQNFSESQTQMVRNLERTLQATVNKEEKDAQDLEALVQQAEQNLQCMTQRALKAESDVEKMKQEMCFLQAELTCYKVENENLRSGQTSNMGAVKQHVEIALQNLLRVTNHAHATIHQLVFGAETLTLVADLLKSVGRMSEVEEEVIKET